MNPADPLPPLPPLPSPPDSLTVREHPIDRALAALSEATVLALASSKPSRFVEAGTLTTLAHQLQQLRPASGIADLGMDDDDGDIGMGPPMMMPRIGRRRGGNFHDVGDLNREMIMMAQGFLKTYQDIEKAKANRPVPDVRLDQVTELAELMQLRMQLMREGADLPPEINTRIDHLLQRIGEPPHEQHPQAESGPGPVVSAEPLRGHPPDGAGQQD
jgi:hypothetical protein